MAIKTLKAGLKTIKKFQQANVTANTYVANDSTQQLKDVQPIKTTDQCKLVKLTVACASDALDGLIKAHLNLIPNN